MEFKSHAKQIYDFLKKHQKIMLIEIIDEFPQSLNDYDTNLYQDFCKLTEHELYQIDAKKYQTLPQLPFLKLHLDEIKHLSTIEKTINLDAKKLEDWAYRDVKFKKRHEIDCIAPLLKHYHNQKKFQRILDIGGGVGHLSRILSYYYSIESKSLDREIDFLNKGKERLKKYPKPIDAAEISFTQLEFGKVGDEEKLNELISDEHFFTLGLHTCGELANRVIDTTIKNNGVGLLSFGCCYHKYQDANYFPRSNYFKQNFDLKLNMFCMTLAARAHKDQDEQNFLIKKQVKYYRSALHLLLNKYFNLNNVSEVGEIHTREYSHSFGIYALSRLNYLKIEHKLSEEEINHFYQLPDIQITLKEIFLKSMIRWTLGRPLEIYILLDRVLYLEENNYEVKIEQYFEESLSPRNLGILAFKKDQAN